MIKKLLDIKKYPKYAKAIFEREIKPKLLVIKDLENSYYPQFIVPQNTIEITEKELHNFDILSHKINIFKKINWYKDISSNRVWPKDNYKKIRIIYPDNSDIKYIWEIGRLQFLVQLGSLYLKTKNERYAIKFKEIVSDFYKENPIKTGPNWKCTMDVAIRAVNLVYAYNYFKESKSINKDFWYNYFNELYKTGQFIRNNLEWAPVRGNHYLSDLVGLFYLGVVFKNTKIGNNWLNFSKKELEKETLLQITNDGVNFEGSTSYHRLICELLLYPYIFGKENNVFFSSNYTKRLKSALTFISAYTLNSGDSPQIGDNDNSQLLKLDNKRSINDHRYLLQLSDIYFETKFNCSNLENEAVFFTNKKNIIKYYKESVCKSFSCGINIFRNKDYSLLIKCGSRDQIKSAGHTHNDQLSFVLEYKGNLFFVDPGTATYTGNTEIRNSFRSTAAHNTININKMEQNKLLDLFYIDLKNTGELLKFKKTSSIVFFKGKFRYIKEDVTPTRQIILDLKANELEIIDEINAKENINFIANFNINSHSKIQGNRIILGNSKMSIKENTNIKLVNSQYSEKYGCVISSKKLIINSTVSKLITKFKFI